jgi:hypothetical protein
MIDPYAKNEPPRAKSIADLLASRVPKAKKRGHPSELHEVVAKLRESFGETAKNGKGSFGFYLALLKRVPISTLYIWLGDIKDSPRLDTPEARRKVFWWKYKVWKTPAGEKPKASLNDAVRSVTRET